jgi:hypothetical protein
MKRIVMTTETKETVTMGKAGKFVTGAPVPVEDDAQADALLARAFPKFKEFVEEISSEPGPKVDKKAVK